MSHGLNAIAVSTTMYLCMLSGCADRIDHDLKVARDHLFEQRYEDTIITYREIQQKLEQQKPWNAQQAQHHQLILSNQLELRY